MNTLRIGTWILAFGTLLACRDAGSAQGGAPAAGAASGWVAHRDPAGFELRHPRGWKVEVGDSSVVVVRSAGGASLVLVQPFLLRERLTPEGLVRRIPRLFSGQLPGARVERVGAVPGREGEAVASLAGGPEGRRWQGTALVSLTGRAGMAYLLAAPQARFAREKPELLRVLESFRFTGGSAAARRPAAPSLRYAAWRDPREGAFLFEAPAGWKVEGGTFRHAPVDVRHAVRATSPDGKAMILAGDADTPPFAVATQWLASVGFPEGSWYSPGYGVNMLVRRYLTGAEFAREYAERMARATGCSGLEVVTQRDLPGSSRALNAIYQRFQQVGVDHRVSTGEVAFTCQRGGRPMRGYLFVGTSRTLMQGMGSWNLQNLYGYLAAADQVPAAEAAVSHMARTLRFDPGWLSMQQGVTSGVSQIVAETNSHISGIIADSYWTRQRSLDDVHRHWSNTMLGQTDVVDPETGESWKVASGRNYYWRKAGSGQVAGTDSYDAPDIDFAPLREW